MVRWLGLLIGTLLTLPAHGQTYTNQAAIIGAGPGVVGFNLVGPCLGGQVLGWSVAGIAQCVITSGTGTVINVGLALPASTFAVTNSPVTTTGTLTGSFVAQTANTFLAGPIGPGPSVPTWRALVGADLPTPTTSTLGGVQAVNPITSRWINSINASGVPQLSQPAFADISGMLAATQCLTPTISTLGCVQANNPVTSNWINSISPSGVPQLSQPSFVDLAGTIGIAQYPTYIPFSLIANGTGSPSQPTNISLSGFIDAAFSGSARGNLLFRGASGWTVLAPDTSGKVLQTAGAGADPAWATVSGTGTMTSISAGSGITLTPSSCPTSCAVALTSIADATLLSNITGGSAAPAANTLTSVIDHDITSANVQGSVLYRSGAGWAALGVGTAGQFLQTQGAGANPRWALTTPTVQRFTSGSGTYTTPAGVQWIEITLVGGGAGGSGGATSSAPSTAGSTCWNTTGAACTTPVYSAGGGAGAAGGGTAGAAGVVSGSGTCNVLAVAGGQPGGGSQSDASVAIGWGSGGGSSSLGGAGASNWGSTGSAAAANSGSGGGGGGSGTTTSNTGGVGGSSGATCKVILGSPAATYTYAVGAGTAGTPGGTGNGFAGGAGAAGLIVVIEHYGP